MMKTFHGVVVSARGSFRGIVTDNLVIHYNTFKTSSYQDGDGAVITACSRVASCTVLLQAAELRHVGGVIGCKIASRR